MGERYLERRAVLKAALGMVLGLPFGDFVAAQELDPKKAAPQEGDCFVFAVGDRKGEIITPKDVPLGGPQLMAYPLDPTTKLVKDGSRLNKVLLIHFDPQDLTDETRAHSADGIVAYSAICTHMGCDVSEWQDETKILICPCHAGLFDPKGHARVVGGPPPRPLAVLPLKIADGVLMAARGFIGRVGYRQG